MPSATRAGGRVAGPATRARRCWVSTAVSTWACGRAPRGAGGNLYQFWGRQIAEHLNHRLHDDPDPVLVTLASQEYFKAVDRKALNARVVECVFEDFKGGAYKIISFYAKRARGLMAR